MLADGDVNSPTPILPAHLEDGSHSCEQRAHVLPVLLCRCPAQAHGTGTGTHQAGRVGHDTDQVSIVAGRLLRTASGRPSHADTDTRTYRHGREPTAHRHPQKVALSLCPVNRWQRRTRKISRSLIPVAYPLPHLERCDGHSCRNGHNDVLRCQNVFHLC